VFLPKKANNAERRKAINRDDICQCVLEVPLNERGTSHDLASAWDLSYSFVRQLTHEGLVQVHLSAIKPFLTEANKEAQF
jgi:hypothetical protein